MKKLTPYILIGTLFLSMGTTLAFAEDSASAGASTTRPGILNTIKSVIKARLEAKQEIKDTKIENHTEIKDMRENASTTRKDMVQKRIENHFDIMTLRIGATIDREEKLITRIMSRIEKIKTAGGSTTNAEKVVDEAKDHIANARKMLEDLKISVSTNSNLNTISLSTSTKPILLGMRKITKGIELELRATHKSLEKIIGILKGMSQTRPSEEVKTQN